MTSRGGRARRTRRLAWAAVAAAVTVGPVVAASAQAVPGSATINAAPAAAQVAAAGAAVVLTPATGHPTARTVVSSSGFDPGQRVAVRFAGAQVATGTANRAGTVRITFQIPKNAAPGPQKVTLVGQPRGLRKSATYTVSTPWHSGFDVRNSGFNRFENILNRTTVPQLQQVWASSPADGFGDYFGAPAVENGLVFAVDDTDSDVAPSLYAFDQSTGQRVWKQPVSSPGEQSPIVFRSTVWDVENRGHSLSHWDAATGRYLNYIGLSGPLSGAQIDGNTLVVSSNTDPDDTGGGATFAYDATTAQPLWTAHAGSTGTPAIDAGTVFAVAPVDESTDTVTALDEATGATVWTTKIGSVFGGSTVANGLVYVGQGDNGVTALNESTGAVIWTHRDTPDPCGSNTCSPVVADGTVFVGDGQGIEALNAATGAMIWNDRGYGGRYSCPSIADGVIYVASTVTPTLDALNTTTGALIDHLPIPGPGTPAISDGVLYDGTGGHGVVAYALPQK